MSRTYALLRQRSQGLIFVGEDQGKDAEEPFVLAILVCRRIEH